MNDQGKLALFGGNPVRTRPFPAWPQFGEEEREHLLEVLESRVWGGYHPKVAQFERLWSRYCGVAHAALTSNGTVALEACLKALGVGPEDEVIVPPLTFVATAGAVTVVGAVPVFVDIDSRTLNLDPERVKEAVTPRTRVVIPVHFAGLPADMDRLSEVAARNEVRILEDAAHAHGSEWEGRRAGSLGDLASFSFQNSKVLAAGEAGAVVGRDGRLVEWVRSYFNQGRRSGGGWFEHDLAGTNGRIGGFQAGVLLAQLGRLDRQIERRTRMAEALARRLREVDGVEPVIPSSQVTRHSFYLLPLVFDTTRLGVSRERLLQALKAEGIPLEGYPYPIYKNRMFQTAPSRVTECPVAEEWTTRMAWVPGHFLLGGEEDVADIADGLLKVVKGRNTL